MRLAHAGDRRPGPGQPRNGNRIWLATCVVTVIVVVFVAVKLTGSGCPVLPRADGSGAAGGADASVAATDRDRAAGDAGSGSMTSPLAARPVLAGPTIEGHAVFYDPGQAAGSCGLGPFPAGGGGKAQPAIIHGAACCTAGWPDRSTLG